MRRRAFDWKKYHKEMAEDTAPMTTTTTNLRRKDLLDHGFVRLVDFMGKDLSIIRAARVSHDAAWRAGEDEQSDKRLLRRLWTGGRKTMPEIPRHSTPFEAVCVSFEIMAPIFVFRQWHRHRTQSYNELSARYRELPRLYYLPAAEQVGKQSKNNKQGRTLEDLTADALADVQSDIDAVGMYCETAFNMYDYLLGKNWPKELARIVLPVNVYSHMFATGNLLNWLKFLSLRADAHAQPEIRVYADAIAELLVPIVPETMALWREAMASTPS